MSSSKAYFTENPKFILFIYICLPYTNIYFLEYIFLFLDLQTSFYSISINFLINHTISHSHTHTHTQTHTNSIYNDMIFKELEKKLKRYPNLEQYIDRQIQLDREIARQIEQASKNGVIFFFCTFYIIIKATLKLIGI